jgi:hypothetical protein
MRKGKDNWVIACSHERLRATRKNAKKTRRQWVGQLVCALAVVFAATWVDADEINTNMVEIPIGPGKVCVKYATGYSALVDRQGGTPAELGHYIYISYDGIRSSHTVHSCVGGYPQYPGPLPEGRFFLLLGGLITQAAIVNIERIQDKCPYMLTYYLLKNPIRIPDPDGICVKGKPAPTNTPNPDPGKPDCPQTPLN